MIDKLRTESTDELFRAILTLKTVEECYALIEDLCTVKEIISIRQRFEVAKMLIDKRSYNEIVEKTGASTATISRVNRSLVYGNDGYSLAFDRLKENKDV